MSYLWVFCIIKCTASKLEVSLFPPLERAGLLQQLSFFNTGLGTKQNTRTEWKSNPKPNSIQNQWSTHIRILNTATNILQITGENISFPSQVNQENVQKVPESKSEFPTVLKKFTGRTGYWWTPEDRVSVFSCVPTGKATRLHQTVPNPRPHTQPWLNSLGHKTKRHELEKSLGWGQGKEKD